MFALVVLDLVFLVPRKEIDREERLQNDFSFWVGCRMLTAHWVISLSHESTMQYKTTICIF